jgi:hypothetical protein
MTSTPNDDLLHDIDAAAAEVDLSLVLGGSITRDSLIVIRSVLHKQASYIKAVRESIPTRVV